MGKSVRTSNFYMYCVDMMYDLILDCMGKLLVDSGIVIHALVTTTCFFFLF